MKALKTYLKGKSVFIVSLIVILLTFLTVYLSGINYNRTLTSNLYLSLTIIASALLIFITYGLFKGVELIDNFPKLKVYKARDYLPYQVTLPDFPNVDVGEGISGLILSILLWIGMSILFILLLILVEAVFWISVCIISAMLYWVFFRALKFVFSRSDKTKGDLGISTVFGLCYTALYVSWLFGIVYLTQILK